MQDDSAGRAPRRTALSGEEADRRKALLARLQHVLATRGVPSVLAGRHILTLRGGEPAQPLRPGDPELHVLGAGRPQVITTDGRNYRLPGRGMHLADDPVGAARLVLPAAIRPDDAGRVPAPADQGAGGRDRAVGAGERALRRLCEDGII